MPAALRAGFLYFAIMFAFGFALGTLRVLVLVPALGELFAVVLEVPVMLALSWWVAGRLTQGKVALATIPTRLGMGVFAFVLLQSAEFVLTITLFGATPDQFITGLGTLAGATGLLAQVVFALIPWLRLITRQPS